MPQSLTKIYIHLIFSTRGRKPLIPTEIQPRLHAYMASALHSMESTVVQIGGVEDHVHVLSILNKTTTLSDLVKKLKTVQFKFDIASDIFSI
jgi:REP element-mobilizing transposase RayT